MAGADSDAAALAVFRQLRRLNVTVECLKATKRRGQNASKCPKLGSNDGQVLLVMVKATESLAAKGS